MIETLGKRIKERRRELRMTQKELSCVSGLSQGTISALENQTLKTSPNVETIYKLAQSLHVDFDYLLLNDSSVNFPLQADLFLVEDKIIQKTPFYHSQHALENWILYREQTERYKYFAAYLHIDLGVTISDNAMYPQLMKNDRVFVHETTDVQNGEIVVVLNKKVCMIRKINKEKDQITLQALNPHYLNSVIQTNNRGDYQILGKVMFYIRYIEDNPHFQKLLDSYSFYE